MKKIFTHLVIILDNIQLSKPPGKKARKFDDDLKFLDQLNFIPPEEIINILVSYSK
ncbi:MAG: hypothetical protein GXO79_05470 [Chlorobi bacterium]|nr:hypothetical protein [Chlorobiota bacterium]